jgi:hypothetical protein
MIERIADAPPGVVALRAVGTVSAADYEDVMRPAIEAAIAEHGRARVVVELGPGFEGYSSGAALEDLKLGASHLTSWERCAIVTDNAGVADAVRVISLLLPGQFAAFPVAELDRAIAWAAGDGG